MKRGKCKNIEDDICYQGKDINKEYFEGWYFKHVTCTKVPNTISIIVGVSKSISDTHSFIQVIEDLYNKSYYIRYGIDEFSFSDIPFNIKIGDNTFSKKGVILNIDNGIIKLKGSVIYNNILKIARSIYAPSIMGPFSYFKNMECNHSIISMGHNISGQLIINDNIIILDNGVGYMEKDYGTSFPKKYIWLQAIKNVNIVSVKNDKEFSSIFLAIADIPFIKLNFRGVICVYYINNIEYRFATYYGCRCNIIKQDLGDKRVYKIILKQGRLKLEVEVEVNNGLKLKAPKKGCMCSEITENLDGICSVKLYTRKKVIYESSYEKVTCEMEI